MIFNRCYYKISLEHLKIFGQLFLIKLIILVFRCRSAAEYVKVALKKAAARRKKKKRKGSKKEEKDGTGKKKKKKKKGETRLHIAQMVEPAASNRKVPSSNPG